MTAQHQHADSPILFVGQLPFTSTQEDLYTLFSTYGSVIGVRMSRKSMRREGKFAHLFTGVAHVEYDSGATAAAALTKLKGLEYKGRVLRADLAAPRQGESEAVARPPTSAPSDTLFVANLPFKFDVDMLEAVFKTTPGFVKVRATDEGVEKGWAYVQYESVETAVAAVGKFNGQFFKSRAMRLDYANSTNTTVVKSNAGKEAKVPVHEKKAKVAVPVVTEGKKANKAKQAKRSAEEAEVGEEQQEQDKKANKKQKKSVEAEVKVKEEVKEEQEAPVVEEKKAAKKQKRGKKVKAAAEE